ncbi:MAG TPA: uroporphyrinogen decarboxylase family protein [Oscillospiraceae bacterium]|nr:uroporphyrinogen decarboxylase family protein [Oscillospiraceae bacterium]
MNDIRGSIYKTDAEKARLDELFQKWRDFCFDYSKAEPKLIMHAPLKRKYTIGECMRNPAAAMETQIENFRFHQAVGDDAYPALRAEFGTVPIAEAFGCKIYRREDELPCTQSTIVNSAEEIDALKIPDEKSGSFPDIDLQYEFFLENLPYGVGFMLPDLQGPFNNTHLLRGNDIFTDFYDEPESVEKLLNIVTQYQIKMTRHYHKLCGIGKGFLYDWSGIWRGNLRICNCTLHNVSTEFYETYIKKYDRMLLDTFSEGRIHYCGTHDNGQMASFFSIPNLYGVDFDGAHHNILELAPRTPERVALLPYMNPERIAPILAGKVPEKRNIIYEIYTSSFEEAKTVCTAMKSVLGVSN